MVDKEQLADIEKNSLEAHVNLSIQRHNSLADKLSDLTASSAKAADTVDANNKMITAAITSLRDQYNTDLQEIRQNQNTIINHDMQRTAELKDHHTNELKILRNEFINQGRDTTKVIVGAAATIGAGLLSTIIVLLVAFL